MLQRIHADAGVETNYAIAAHASRGYADGEEVLTSLAGSDRQLQPGARFFFGFYHELCIETRFCNVWISEKSLLRRLP